MPGAAGRLGYQPGSEHGPHEKMKTYIFVINLLKGQTVSRPRVTREIEVGENSNLYDFAEAIVGAYGFDFDHAFGFFSRTDNDYLYSEFKYELLCRYGRDCR